MRLFLLFCLLLTPAPALADDFAAWLYDLKAEAAARGIQPQTLAALDNVSFKERVIELDQSQPESRLTHAEYLARTVTPARIAKGRELLAQHRTLLTEIGAAYGVQPRFIVALWGKETDFGRFTGGFNVLDALATLAFEGRRASYFRGELINALHIIDGGHIPAERMLGSWAGAMGQCQFMPTSFFKYAVDGNNDGKTDIWRTLPDVFASTANYLRTEGWNNQQNWGRAVQLTRPIPQSYFGTDKVLRLAEWTALGVVAEDGRPLPATALDASLIQPDRQAAQAGENDMGGQAYLVYNNFRVLLHWNRSSYFATAVGILADAIGQ